MDEQQNPHEDHTRELPASESEDQEQHYKPDFSHHYQEDHNQHKERSYKKIILAIAALILIGLATLFFIRQSSQRVAPQQPAQLEQEETPLQVTSISEETKSYSSSTLGLTFDYPDNWEVTEVAGSKLVTATSPIIDVPVTDTQYVSGRVVLTLSSNAQSLERFDSGNAAAVVRSEKIAYTKPSSVQRGETYISYVSYPDSTDSTLLDAMYITGDFGYQKDQAIPKVDISKIDPITSIHFYSCDGSCETPLAVTEQALNNPLFGDRLKQILKSLTIK